MRNKKLENINKIYRKLKICSMYKKEMYIFVLIIKELEYQYTSKRKIVVAIYLKKEFIHVIIVNIVFLPKDVKTSNNKNFM